MCSISRRKTNDEFIYELHSILPDVEVLTPYHHAHEKVLCRCKIDGTEWWSKPCQLLSGRGCRVCGYKTVSKKTHIPFETAVKTIHEANPNIEVLYEFFDECWKVHCKCKIDGYEWDTQPRKIAYGDGCSRCSHKEKKTTESFSAELALIHPDIEVIGEYKTTHTKIECRCKRDGYVWSPTPRNLLAGWGCPHCRQSRGEKKIAGYLKSHGIEYCPQHAFEDCADVHVLLFDFYLPERNTAIEYDGEQHFRPVKFGGKNDTKSEKRFELVKRHDAVKTQYCQENNINLIRVDYTHFDDLEMVLDKHLL